MSIQPEALTSTKLAQFITSHSAGSAAAEGTNIEHTGQLRATYPEIRMKPKLCSMQLQ